MKQFEICEYKDEQQRFKDFYLTMQNKSKTTRVLQALKHNKNIRNIWQAGLVCILAIDISQWRQLAISLKHSSILVLSALLWSTLVGVSGIQWIRKRYDQELTHTCDTMAKELGQIRANENCNAWIMTNDDQIVGTVAFKLEKNEGQIGYLTGLDSDVRLKLVQHAFNFGKSKGVKVISRLKQATFDSRWSDKPL